MSIIRVRAVADRSLLAVDGDGHPRPGRFVGRDRRGAIVAAGVDVPDDSYHRRAIKAGDLELVEEAGDLELVEEAV